MIRFKKHKIFLFLLFVFICCFFGSYYFFRQNVVKDPIITQTTEETSQSVTTSTTDTGEPPVTTITEPILTNSAWIAYWDLNGAKDSIADSTNLDSISPAWYTVSESGSIELKIPAVDESLIYQAHLKNLKIMPSISNTTAEKLSVILNNPTLLNYHIESILAEIRKYNYDGIDIDYENIHASDRDTFTNFIKLLTERVHSEGRKVSIAILWKNEYDEMLGIFSESRSAQDWVNIGSYVDEFKIMAYNFTSSAEEAGPIAPYDWIKSILEYAVKKVDRSKIVLGLPLYAYEWTNNAAGARVLTWKDVETIRTSGEIQSDKLDEKYQEKILLYGDKTIWYQDKESTDKRIELAKSFEIYKFAFWRLGGEDPSLF